MISSLPCLTWSLNSWLVISVLSCTVRDITRWSSGTEVEIDGTTVLDDNKDDTVVCPVSFRYVDTFWEENGTPVDREYKKSVFWLR